MCDHILCVTNRKLCKGEFLLRIEQIAAAHPGGVILREKNLEERDYRHLAQKVIEICRRHGTKCILHGFADAARELKCDGLHLPLEKLRALPTWKKAAFPMLGASCHSIEDAKEAQALGCTYVIAGHVFDTDCKKGMPGRGLGFLKEVAQSVDIPVYAIGGIAPCAMGQVQKNGAAGACVMSGAMMCQDVKEYLWAFGKEWKNALS